ncbi:MAG: hypothetical protein GX207_10310 [Peptococcaceae bacterium]|nr:hypothetical protein [Peptococcaceae bacterium]
MQNHTNSKLTKRILLLRTFAVWTLVSLILQFGLYFFLNNAAARIMSVPQIPAGQPPVYYLEADLPDSNPENIQISYTKDYLAYMADGVFKVFNLKQNKPVFSKGPVSPEEKGLGVLNYQWLPDRNTLIYFYAKKNPNPYSIVLVPRSAPAQEELERVTVYTPQLTYLYTLELPDSNEDISPVDRENITISNFPAEGKVKQIATSTYTNLIYVLIETNSAPTLMEIDVMYNVRFLQQAGETILDFAASDQLGTLFVQNQRAGNKHILAVEGEQRTPIAVNNNYIILGSCSNNLYIGEVIHNRLTQIFVCNDSPKLDKDDKYKLSSFWQGEIPFTEGQVGIDSQGKIVIYEANRAYIITEGGLKTKTIEGDNNFLSPDGAALIKLTKRPNGAGVQIIPLS